MGFRIVTDASCDLTQRELFMLGIESFPIGLIVGEESFPDKNGYFPDVGAFYLKQAAAKHNSTGSMGIDPVIKAFRPALLNGHDVLYAGIDFELSEGVMNSVLAAREVLLEEFPGRRIEIPETHSIAPGLGLMLTRLAEFCGNDKVPLDKALAEVNRLSRITAHYFTVSNYDQLSKSGRVSAGTRFVATALNIKPFMVLPRSGKLTVHEKIRGDIRVLKRFATEVADTIEDVDRRVWISYGADSGRKRAEELAYLIESEMTSRGLPPVVISYHRIGPIIGAHVGPTVLAAFFFAKGRM